MVRALLAGRKTQTRRLASSPLSRCAPGDRLYVREAWGVASIFTDVVEVRYQASERQSHTEFVEQVAIDRAERAKVTWPKYQPSIHMPRWASRVTLAVTDIRVQRLQAITAGDAIAEGVDMESADPPFYYVPGIHPHSLTGVGIEEPGGRHAERSFGKLWGMLHDKPGERWEDNPEIVALTFSVLRGNIDLVSA